MNAKTIILIIVLVILIISIKNVSGLTFQPGPSGCLESEEFQVNNYTQDFQIWSDTSTDNEGNFIIAWQDEYRDGSEIGIYAQIFDKNGKRVGKEFGVNTYTTNWQRWPDVAYAPDGTFIITWTSGCPESDCFGQDGYEFGIFAQKFDRDGVKIGKEFQVNNYTRGTQEDSEITFFKDGRFIIVWESIQQDGSGYGLFAQIFDNNLNKIGNEFQINTYTNGTQSDASIGVFPNGDILIVWESYDQDGSKYGIFGQFFDSRGNRIGTEFQINTEDKDNQLWPQVTIDSEEDFIVTWSDYNKDTEYDIVAQKFDRLGNRIGNEFQVNTYSLNYQRWPQITVLENNNFLISWESFGQDGFEYGIFAQKFDKDRNKLGGEFQINSYTQTNQTGVEIAFSSESGIVFTWSSYEQDESSYGIYAKIIKSGDSCNYNFPQIEKHYSDWNLTENITLFEAKMTKGNILGDMKGLIDFNNMEIISIESDNLKGSGIIISNWKAALNGVVYNGDIFGILIPKLTEKKIYIKGTIFGDNIEGLIEGYLTESILDSNKYDNLYSKWIINIFEKDIISSNLFVEGNLSFINSTKFTDVKLSTMQLSFDLITSGQYVEPISGVLTHSRISDNTNMFNDLGYSIYSYNSKYGQGEGWAFDYKDPENDFIFTTGLFSEPLKGIFSGVIDIEDNQNLQSIILERVDLGQIPTPELKVSILGPTRVSPGQTIDYIIQYENNGLKLAENVSIGIQMPEFLEYISSSSGGIYLPAESPSSEIWFEKEIPPKSQNKKTITIKVPWGLAQGTSIGLTSFINDNIPEIRDGFCIRKTEIIQGITLPDVGDFDSWEGTPIVTLKETRLLIREYPLNPLIQNLGNNQCKITFRCRKWIIDQERKCNMAFAPNPIPGLEGRWVYKSCENWHILSEKGDLKEKDSIIECKDACTIDPEYCSEDKKTNYESNTVTARDPNIKYGKNGYISINTQLNYSIEFENEGEGIAYGVYIIDKLDYNLNDSTLQIGDVKNINNGSIINFPGTYDEKTRTITWFIGEVKSKEGGYTHINISINKNTSDETQIINYAIVYFPSVPEITKTNGIVTIIGIDSDNDNIIDIKDNCPYVLNPNQNDIDNDSIGDICDNQTCGNGKLESPEECDDSNILNNDSCSSFCLIKECQKDIDCNDNNICTDEKCDLSIKKCIYNYNEISCDDGFWCNGLEICNKGFCESTAVTNCSVFDDQCNSGICDEGADRCAAVPKADGTSCTDSDLCTTEDACVSGTCVPGTPKNCNDNNMCTEDSCNSMTGQCAYTFNTKPCDDTIFCTTNDVCSQGKCSGTPRDCSAAADQCNTGECSESSKECVAKPRPNRTPCDDGNLCTMGDACADGRCVPEDDNDCDDNNWCTDDHCEPPTGKCIYTFNTQPCDDMAWCTINDICSEGACSGQERDCDMQEQCKLNFGICSEELDECNPFPAPDGTVCDDNNPNTPSDKCISGKCIGTQQVEKEFTRGNVNGGQMDIGDAIFILNYLFASGQPPECIDAADVNDDGQLDIGDPISLLNYLFASGPKPGPPFDAPGTDPTPDGLPVCMKDVQGQAFVRGDVNGGGIDLTDINEIIEYVFRGNVTLTCLDAADVNDDGNIGPIDSVLLIKHVFEGTADPLPPFPEPGFDTTPDILDCLADPNQCTPGQQKECYKTNDFGSCLGVQRCSAQGTWERCGAREAGNEICDGLDNDCSGIADDNLQPPLCELQAFLCEGSVKTCGGAGGWLKCGPNEYGPLYEPFEKTVNDSIDNDCDGMPDWFVCDDGTQFGECSPTLPFQCLAGKENGGLVENCQSCPCPAPLFCRWDNECAPLVCFEGGGIQTPHGNCSVNKPMLCQFDVDFENVILRPVCSICGCPEGQTCNEQTGSCESQQKCADGTPFGECSATKPKYCFNGELMNLCDACECPSGYVCGDRFNCVEPKCSDGTPAGQCSVVNKEYYCAWRGGSTFELLRECGICGCPEGLACDKSIMRCLPPCPDGTPFGECSAEKPMKCVFGILTPECSECGCPEGMKCNRDIRQCENESVYYSKKTSKAVTVDGDVSEWVDLKHNQYQIPYSSWVLPELLQPVSNDSDLEATFMSVWDDNYLYLFVMVADDSIRHDSGNDIWDDDSVELYLDGGYERSSAYDSNDFQLTVDVNNDFSGLNSENIAGVQHSVNRKWLDFYEVEYAIPFQGLKVTPAAGKLMGFDIGVNDDDDGGVQEHQIMWHGNGTGYLDPRQFGRLVLVE